MRAAALLALIVMVGSAALAGCASPGAGASTSASPPAAAGGSSPSTSQSTAPASGTQHAQAPSASATTGSIRGVVVDEGVHPIANATVRLTAVEKTVRTGASGTFSFGGLQPGTYFLEVKQPRYRTVQTSAKVVAGQDAPEPVNVVLPANPSAQPRVDAYKLHLVVSSQFCVASGNYCNHVMEGTNPVDQTRDSFFADIEPNATVLQAEVQWSPGTPLAQTAKFSCTISSKDSVSQTYALVGASPLALRMDGTVAQGGKTGTARLVVCPLVADPTASASALVDQDADVVLHAFYNFEPRADWRFSRDGDYPVPT